MKEEFIELLKSTKREGVDEIINFLEKTDFFKAPASTRFHGNYEGGLLEHSMKVYEILKHKVKNSVIDINVGDDTLIIVALLHDICKANYYKVDFRNVKNERGEWEKVPGDDNVTLASNLTGLNIAPHGVYTENTEGRTTLFNRKSCAAYWISGEETQTLSDRAIMLLSNSNELTTGKNKVNGKNYYVGLTIRCVME